MLSDRAAATLAQGLCARCVEDCQRVFSMLESLPSSQSVEEIRQARSLRKLCFVRRGTARAWVCTTCVHETFWHERESERERVLVDPHSSHALPTWHTLLCENRDCSVFHAHIHACVIYMPARTHTHTHVYITATTKHLKRIVNRRTLKKTWQL